MVVNVTKTDPNAKDPLIGQRVGASYTILQLLGSGGMGTVYLAESGALGGQKIAVKVLTTKSNDAIARFVREAYAAGKVNDQFSVVGLVDTGVLQTGQHYIALQYCDGGSLQALLEGRIAKPLPFDDILSFMSPVCAALVHAHAANLVHRDIKPANILFVTDGTLHRTRLADFGIVKLREHAGLLLTAPKSIMGTPGYMSPEQWMDTGEVDSRADIYSIGCVLYELVTRRLPYSGTTNEVMQQTKHNAPITPPVALRPDTPPMWNTTIMRCLAHRREDRIQTILEVIHNLAGAIENGEATMGFFAPSLVTSIATAPTANTISQSAGGPARTLWSRAHSAIQQRKSSTSSSRRRSWAMFVAGVAIGTVTTGAVTRSASPEPDAPRIALDGREAARAATAQTMPDAPHVTPEAREVAHAAPVPTVVSEPAAARTVAHVDAALEDVATIDAAAPEFATSAARNATAPGLTTPAVRNSSETTVTKPLSPSRPRPTTPPPPEPPPNRAPTISSSSDSTSEAWLSLRVKGAFAQVSIDGDKPSMSPKRKRVQVGMHHIVMTGYPSGSETEQRREFDVNVPAGRDETIIYKTW
jgi:eukaryotic-like serine/threonine-protein kinase